MLQNQQTNNVPALDNVALAVITREEIDCQVATANKFPRDLVAFDEKVTSIIQSSPDIARKCYYIVPRGDGIEGPNVRLAEIMVRHYKNSRIAGRVINVAERSVKAQAIAFDAENNISYLSEVERSIVDKKGNRYSNDMIIMTGNAAVAIAMRNVSFKMIGGLEADKYFRMAQQVVMEGKTGRTIEESVEAMITEFQEKLEIDEATLLRKLKVEDRNQINKITLMRAYGIFNALEAGDITKAQWLANDSEDGGKIDLEQPKNETEGGGTTGAPEGAETGMITAETLRNIRTLVSKNKKLQAVLNDELIKYGALSEDKLSFDGGIAVLDALREAKRK